MPAAPLASDPLTAEDRSTLARAVGDLARIFGVRLEAVVAYGLRHRAAGEPLHALVLVERLSFEDLAACAPAAREWRRLGIGAPLILERAEFERTLDVFPLEYGDILAHHVAVFGDDPLAGLVVEQADIRRAIEFHAKSLLIHLREGFIETGADAVAVGELIARSAPAFESLLSSIARLCNDTHGDLPAMAEARIGVPAATVGEVLAAGHREPSAVEDLTPLMGRYIEAATKLWGYVDGWQGRA